jgi:hypothetical protein
MELGFQLQVGWNAKAHSFPSSEGAALKKNPREVNGVLEKALRGWWCD